jgi:hypothetical protein
MPAGRLGAWTAIRPRKRLKTLAIRRDASLDAARRVEYGAAPADKPKHP